MLFALLMPVKVFGSELEHYHFSSRLTGIRLDATNVSFTNPFRLYTVFLGGQAKGLRPLLVGDRNML